jgi:hypothetical protein
MKDFWSAILITMLAACNSSSLDNQGAAAVAVKLSQNDEWKKHWYDGNAEVNVYTTAQARYQDIHPGKTVLIFVTEDFLTGKQVKNESYEDKASTSVLKTNLIRKFDTGVYDYSIMTSVFTPVDHEKFPNTLKINMTSQDWCGHSFFQLNHEKGKYRVSQYSYFEKEADEIYSVPDLMTEDELFNQIRFNPEFLPVGNLQILPGIAFSRLSHKEYKAYAATLSRSPYEGSEFQGNNLEMFQVTFPELDRNLEIVYESAFPYKIVGWKDTYAVMSGEKLTSISNLISSKRMPYWSEHDLEDGHLRTELGL